MAKAGLLTRPTDLGLRQTLPLSRPKALLQRTEPVGVSRRAVVVAAVHAVRHQKVCSGRTWSFLTSAG